MTITTIYKNKEPGLATSAPQARFWGAAAQKPGWHHVGPPSQGTNRSDCTHVFPDDMGRPPPAPTISPAIKCFSN